jgi:transcriptional regulator of acetoin/glycerol metabolism
MENAIEYAVAVCKGQTLHAEDLPAEITRRPARSAASPPAPAPGGEPGAGELLRVLEAHRWKRAEVARALGVSRTTLWRMMREAGLARD